MKLDRIIIVVWHDDEQDANDPQQYDLTFEGTDVPRDELALYRNEVEKKLSKVLDRVEAKEAK